MPLALAMAEDSPKDGMNDVRLYSLDEMTAAVNREAGLAVSAALTSLQHAINAGEILAEIRKRLIAEHGRNSGAWGRWVDEHFEYSGYTARVFVRLATYKDDVLAACEQGELRSARGVGWSTAFAWLTHHPPVDGAPRGGYDPQLRQDACEMVEGGVAKAEVARQYNVDVATVRRWTNKPSAAADERRRVRYRAARAALKRQERDRAMRKVGGSVAESYSLIRKTAQELDRACADATDAEVRAELTSALADLHRVEDRIVRALGIE